MRIELQSLFAATLAVTLLAACGERAEESTAAAPAAEQQPAPSPDTAPGTTTTFGESTPEPQQPPAQ